VFRFDLQGYVVLKGVLSPAEVAAANAAVDAHLAEFAGLESAQDMLGWDERAPFVRMLAHPRLVPYLNCICGPGFRMDHAPTMIMQSKGDDTQLGLHGSSGPGFDPKQYYLWRNGQMHNGLVVVTWQLNDQMPGDGGFCYVPGTHKSNLRGPAQLYSHKSHRDLIKQARVGRDWQPESARPEQPSQTAASQQEQALSGNKDTHSLKWHEPLACLSSFRTKIATLGQTTDEIRCCNR
jgi:hypothetical protein